VGYKCYICEKTYKTIEKLDRHDCKVKEIKREKHVPIQRITKGGETYYRWGDSGKLYKDRADAEAQARAAYASGYKENEREASKMDGIQIRYIDTIQKYKSGNKT
jgi:hypothetical protein